MEILLPPAYFAPISFFALVANQDKIHFEIFENIRRQTIRNRCLIYGANGKLVLSVPLSRGNEDRLIIKDARISYDMNWQKIHWKSIESAYRSSAYFEFYEDEIRPLFERKHKFLIDLNNDSLGVILKILKISPEIFYTNKFEKLTDKKDCREFPDQHPAKKNFPEYTQVFSSKLPFIADLSILDLVFNEGPHSKSYFESIRGHLSEILSPNLH